MLPEGPTHELLVWDGQEGWRYESCGLFLLTAPGLPIHRDIFTRGDIAKDADKLRRACVNEENGYRGGLTPIASGVFQVAVSGRPYSLRLGEWDEEITLNAIALEKGNSTASRTS